MAEQTPKPNAVIWYLASRPCLRESLELLYRNFNARYRYPVLVFTFGNQYSDSFVKQVQSDIDSSIEFVEIPFPEIPSDIAESELFYNRKEIPYVKKYFPKSRIGFLHANQLVTGLAMEYPQLQKYDYVLKLDDDHFFVQDVGFDFFRFMKDNAYKFGVFAEKDFGYERAGDTQIGLRELAKQHVQEYHIIPEGSALTKDGEWNSIGSQDPTIWDMSVFWTPEWKQWWDRVNESGGIYKYRWGDLEIHALFMRMHYPDQAWHNFDFYANGVIEHGGRGAVHQESGIKKLARRWKRRMAPFLASFLKQRKKNAEQI